jgi:hypothetical protein
VDPRRRREPGGGAQPLGGGKLTIAATVTGGGTIEGLAGSTITLSQADLVGGTLGSAGAVTIKGGGDVFDGTTAAFTNEANITLADKASATLEGTIVNSGAITLAATTDATGLVVAKAGAMLSGGGRLTLGGAALDSISGATAAATLTNVDNTISGGGLIGGGKMVLINGAAGLIDQTGAGAMTIDTGTKILTNAGTLEASGAGGTTIAGAVDNTGLLEALKGNLTVAGAVTGTGSAVINSATLTFDAGFTQNVQFSKGAGELVLAKSLTYTGAITGFAKTGGTTLDLGDIGFVSASEATFSGTRTGGVLTVSDGMHTAKITRGGDYLGTTFTASSDGHAGVLVIGGPTPAGAPSVPAFAAAMAAIGAPATPSIHDAASTEQRTVSLLGPRAALR